MPAKSYQYDVFLSHNRAQKDWTRDLARRLRDDGLKVWLDEWVLPQQAGRNWSAQLVTGIQASRKIVMVWSPEFFANDWPTFEGEIIQLIDPVGREDLVIPLMHTPSKIPDDLDFHRVLDFTSAPQGTIEFEFRYQQLVHAVDNSRPYEGDFNRFKKLSVKREDRLQTPVSSSHQAPSDKMSRSDGPYDVFLSHSHVDADTVESLGSLLEDEANLHVWLDKWVLVPGSKWQQEMAKGLEEAKTCAVCVGKHTPKGWFKEEIEKALNRQTKDASFRVIPVILPGADSSSINDFLELRTWVEFKKAVHDPEAFYLLICGIKGIPPGRFHHRRPEDLDDEHALVRERLERIRILRREQLIDDDIALEYQRKILDQSIIMRGKK